MWLRKYLYVVVILIISGVLYGGVLPGLVSSPDTILVIIGIAVALMWPAVVVNFIYRQYKKVFKK